MLSNTGNVDNNQVNQQQNIVNKNQHRQQQQTQFHNNEVPQFASPASNSGSDFRYVF